MYIQWFGRDALTKEKPEKPLEFYIYRDGHIRDSSVFRKMRDAIRKLCLSIYFWKLWGIRDTADHVGMWRKSDG